MDLALISPPSVIEASGKCRASACGVEFDPAISFQEWAEFGRKIVRLQQSVLWIIGDWLNWGHAKFDQGRYVEAIQRLPYQQGTLQNCAYVAARIEFSRRREGLTFAHHQEICPLDHAKQEKYLNAAQKHSWSTADLRQAIRRGEAEFKPETRQPLPKPPFALAHELHLWLGTQDFKEWTDTQCAVWTDELRPIAEFYERLASFCDH